MKRYRGQVMQETKRICRKCLVRELEQAEEYQNMFAYIAQMDADIKTESFEYEKRLTLCKECEKLNQGTCGACGCFVELRAAVKNKSCPYKKW